ncbi:MAG: ComEA family DNA-binding protein [Limisphaerales bacterium]
MKLLPENTSVQSPALQLARLSGPHGYRFDGDTVHLNARFMLLNPAAHDRSWALQLWACPSAPASASDLAGHLVAEASLPPMGEIADDTEHIDISAPAWPPAGTGEHVMVLVLAAGRPDQFNDIHDLAFYSRSQSFIQPRMTGTVGYRVEGARVQISFGRIENPHAVSNRSGTLSLELWALPAPFAGGRFQGHHLAGVEIGFVNGGSELLLQPIDLAFTPPTAGKWHIVLMLREWTAAGFVTRDFTNFAVPFVSEAVVEKPVSVPAPQKSPIPIVEKPVLPAAARTATPEVKKPIAPVLPSPALAPVKDSVKCVSVNSARPEELAAVKGLSLKLAEGIVKKRPFTSLEELRQVKGLGASLLAKIRSNLKL